MPLQAPRLDDRTFDELVTQARLRIPQFTPEWTNFNDSDPGMALVQLHAWLTETILYRLNQVPDLNYIAFLNLINVQPRPATPARAELTFTLKKLSQPSEPLLVLIPQRTRVAVDDPDLAEELLFETDRTLRAVNASIAAIITTVGSDASAPSRHLATLYDDGRREAAIPQPFHPFGAVPASAEHPTMFIGLLLRPHRKGDPEQFSLDRFPSGELDLTIFTTRDNETDTPDQDSSNPVAMRCRFPWEVTDAGSRVVWEAYIGTQHATDFDDDRRWQALDVLDETAGLTRSGHVFLDIPANLPAAGFGDLDAAGLWDDLGLKKPPGTADELVAAIETGFNPLDLDVDAWAALGLEDPDLEHPTNLINQIRSTNLTFGNVALDDWIAAGFHAPPVPHRLVWLRARMVSHADDVPLLSSILLNTVGATAAVTVTDEIVGTATGRPNLTLRLRHFPVIVLTGQRVADITIEARVAGTLEEWRVVEDFHGARPTDAFVTVDPSTGTLTFGDGKFGRIPVAGAEIIARRYRYGGGQIGNAGPGTITSLRGGVFDVDSVTNHRPAHSGGDAEELDAVKLRAPHDLRTRDRAVTADDFAELARQTPGVRIHTAFALPNTRVDLSTQPHTFAHQAGAVTVVILPASKDDRPEPSDDQLRAVCAHLNQRRLITTELYAIGPRYLTIRALRAELTVRRDYDLKAVYDNAVARLLTYFHPLRGGEDGRGWPFGQDIFFGNVYRQLLSDPGVARVLCLDIDAGPGNTNETCDDVLSIPDGTLVYLARTAIDIEVRHDRRG